jgi:hypothetical protein
VKDEERVRSCLVSMRPGVNLSHGHERYVTPEPPLLPAGLDEDGSCEGNYFFFSPSFYCPDGEAFLQPGAIAAPLGYEVRVDAEGGSQVP